MPATATDRLQGLSTAVAIKPPCKAVATTNITLAEPQTVGGVACVAGDRVLVTGQTNGVDNGIWVCSTGSWARAKDFDGSRDVVGGTMIVVKSSSSASVFYEVLTLGPITIGTTPIVIGIGQVGQISQIGATATTRERYAATAGQTVFNLANAYIPGVNALVVIVDGFTLPSLFGYAETSSSVVTFSAGLLAGQQVEFIAGRLVTSGVEMAQIAPVSGLAIHNGGTTATDFASFGFRRIADHTGGTPGWVNSAVRVDHIVSGVGITNYEWALTSVMYNYAAAGENVAAYLLGRKFPGAGATWGAVIECYEESSTADPTTGSVALEIDLDCNGTDNSPPYGARVGCDLAIRRQDAGGPAAAASWGFRIQGDSGSSVGRGFSFFPGMTAVRGFDASTATITGAAFVMAENQAFGFNADITRKLYHDGAGLRFADGSNSIIGRITDAGAFQTAAGVQVLGGRLPGWTAATGTATRTTFATTTVTTEQLAQRLKALIDDLLAHGMIGA